MVNLERNEELTHDILIKVSGDLIESEQFYDWLSTVKSGGGKIFIICGGGTAITEELENHRIPWDFGPMGREIHSQEGQQLSKTVLEKQMAFVQDKLHEKDINAVVLLPFIEAQDRILHMNGDTYMEALYPNFDKIYVVTSKERTKSFPGLERVEVVNL